MSLSVHPSVGWSVCHKRAGIFISIFLSHNLFNYLRRIEVWKRKLKAFLSEFDVRLWISSGILVETLFFLIFNILWLTGDVFMDIITCNKFFQDGQTKWGAANLFFIFNPFFLRFFTCFLEAIKTGSSRNVLTNILEILTSCKLIDILKEASLCLPFIQTYWSIHCWRQMKMQQIYLSKMSHLFRIHQDSTKAALYEAFGEAAPMLIFNLYIFLNTGYISWPQILSAITGTLTLSLTGVRVFFLYRSDSEVDANPILRLKLIVMPWMICNTASSIVLWTYITAYTHIYTFIALPFVFAVILGVTLAFLQSNQQGDSKSFTSVEASLISTFLPCVVGNHESFFIRQMIGTNLGKISMLSCIWAVNAISKNVFYQPLVACISRATNSSHGSSEVFCDSLSTCFCSTTCEEDDILYKTR